MYIKSFFNYESHEKTEKEYKVLLKDLISLDTRKLSKLNLLALYGSSMCLKDVSYKKDLSIYISTHFACINEIFKVLSELKQSDSIMPFDFLNINTNNMGFYLNKALALHGDSYTITSEFLSFEKALYTAFLESKNGINSSFLVGEVDSSLSRLHDCANLSDFSSNITNDISTWFYLQKDSKDTIAKLEEVSYFSSLAEINLFLKSCKYKTIFLNRFGFMFKDELDIERFELKEYSGFSASFSMVNLLSSDLEELVFISLDAKQRGYVSIFSR